MMLERAKERRMKGRMGKLPESPTEFQMPPDELEPVFVLALCGLWGLKSRLVLYLLRHLEMRDDCRGFRQLVVEFSSQTQKKSYLEILVT